jgi:hypothetical protein
VPAGSAVSPGHLPQRRPQPGTATACSRHLRRQPDLRLLGARLLPLAKHNGRGVRPIAIGEVWYWLAWLCALAACPNVGCNSMWHLSVLVIDVAEVSKGSLELFCLCRHAEGNNERR